MSKTGQHPRFLSLLFAVATLLLALVVAPLAGALFAAAVLAVVMHPLQGWLRRRLGDRPRTAAVMLTAGLALVALLPLSWLGLTVLRQLVGGAGQLVAVVEERGIDGAIEQLPGPLQPYAQRLESMLPAGVLPGHLGDAVAPGIGVDPAAADPTAADPAGVEPAAGESAAADGGGRRGLAAAGSLLGTVVVWLRALLAGFSGFVFDVGMLAVALYFLLAEGAGLVRWAVRTSPLSDTQMEQFVTEFRDVTVAVFVSTVSTAALQTAVAAIGYLIAGVPYLAALSLVTLIAAFVPAVGGALVALLCAVWVFAAGSTGMGVFLALWALGPVALCDNIAKPLLAGRRLRLPSSVLFFAMLGGLVMFGAMGIVAGPLIVSFWLVVVRALGAQAGDGGPATA
ncbi:MAG: AI-2E family transporter [Planctomycetota bacterium]